MVKSIQKLFTVALKCNSGLWQIRKINITLDHGNNFHPIWPVNVEWPDGTSGTFLKESISGKCLYEEI